MRDLSPETALMWGLTFVWRRLIRAAFVGSVFAGAAHADETKPAAGPDHPVVPAFERFFHNNNNADVADPALGGRLLLGELNCTACHRAAPAAAVHLDVKQAPVLDAVGTRVRPEFIRRLLQGPRAAKPGTTMPDLFAGWPKAERDEAVEALVHFLASTGSTVDTRIDRKRIADGKLLYQRVGCVACHGPRDGSKAPLSTSAPLPALPAKYTVRSLTAFLLDPHKARPSGRMPALGLDHNEAAAVANYLLKDLDLGFSPVLRYRYYEGNWDKLPDLDTLEPLDQGTAEGFDLSVARRVNDMAVRFEGELRLDAAGEYTFAVTSDDGSRLWIDGQLVVDHDGIHAPSIKEGRATLTKGSHRLVAAVFNSGGGAELDVEMSRAGRGRHSVLAALAPINDPTHAPARPAPERFQVDSALADKGRGLFARVGCASCHDLHVGTERIASALTARDLAALGTGGCLAPDTAPGRPEYGLSKTETAALTAALQTMARQGEQPPATAAVIDRTLLAFNCYACHRRGDRGGVEPARDAFFETTQKEMGDEGRLPPTLTGVGAKLNPDYLRQVLADGAKDRPYMLTRMPRFGAAGTAALASALGRTDHVEPVSVADIDETPRRVKAQGRFLAGGQALGCIKCHTFKGVQAEGVQAIDMTTMTRRLQHDWFHRYLRNPQAFRPGTRMPAAWPDGMSLLPKVLGGDTTQQIEAVWRFLSDGGNAAEPYGLGRDPIPLVPETEAILYRNFIQGAGPRAIAVGYPEKANLAFDANDMRLALIWQGAFIDAARHWHGRGEGFQAPLGDNVVPLPEGPPLAVLSSQTQPWPKEHAKPLGYRFRGYRLTSDQRPTFLFDFNRLHVADFANPVPGTDPPALERTLTMTADRPVDNLWFRAAVGDTIEPRGDRWYLVNGEWKVRILSGREPLVRASGGKTELIAPVLFNGDKAVIHERFEW
jgi:mono/diheme cytochrome c family protein